MLSPKPSNRMLIPRLYITVCWAGLGVTARRLELLETTLWPVIAWTIVSGIALMILTVAILGERDAWSYRVRRKIPRNRVAADVRLSVLHRVGRRNRLVRAAVRGHLGRGLPDCRRA